MPSTFDGGAKERVGGKNRRSCNKGAKKVKKLQTGWGKKTRKRIKKKEEN